MNLPNVRLIHPSVDSNKLLEKCSLVITISGTASLDAGFFQKPAIVFSKRSDMPILSHMHLLQNFEEIPSLIKKLVNSKCDNDEYFQYIDFLKKNCFDLDFPDLVKNYRDYFHYSGFLTDIDIDVIKMEKLLSKIKIQNDLIAKKIIERINSVKTSLN